MSAFGIGTDYGGSIRAPAHFCGVAGLRITARRMPLDGYLATFSPSRRRWSMVGPLGRTVEDVECLMNVLVPNERIPERSLHEIVFLRDAFERPVSHICGEAVSLARAVFESEGINVVDASPPIQEEIELFYDETGLRETRAVFDKWFPERLDEATPQVVFQWEMVSRELLAPLEPKRFVHKAVELERRVAPWLGKHPVLLAPAAASPAFELGALAIEVEGQMFSAFDIFAHCKYPSALGLPTLHVPVLRTAEGLPVGVQLIGNWGEEGQLLKFGRLLEQGLSRKESA